jgi:hypothetical protein
MAKRESAILETKQAVLDALGGDHAVAALTGAGNKSAGYKVVEGWRRAKTFPARYFLVMTFALHRIGRAARPELWGQVTPTQRRRAVSAMIAEVQKQRSAA